ARHAAPGPAHPDVSAGRSDPGRGSGCGRLASRVGALAAVLASPDHHAAVRLVAPQLAGAAGALTRARTSNATAAALAGLSGAAAMSCRRAEGSGAAPHLPAPSPHGWQ